MENEILQSLKESVEKEKLPDFEKMGRKELYDWVITHVPLKERLIKLVNYVYLAVQQSYFDCKSANPKTDEFNLLEGRIRIDNEGKFIFTPNQTVLKLLKQVKEDQTTRLKVFLGTKFYKIIEFLYNTEIKGYEEAVKQKEGIPPKVLEIAVEEEKEKIKSEYLTKLQKLRSEYESLLKEKQEDYEGLESIIDLLQEELNMYKAQQGKINKE